MRDLRRIGPVLRIAAFALVIAALALFLRHVPWGDLKAAFVGANVGWIGVAAALALVGIVSKGMVLRALLAPVARLTVPRAARYTFAAATGCILAPLRAGDILRAWLLVRCEGVTLAACGAVYACEKIGDLAVLLLLSIPLPWVVGSLPEWARWTLWALTTTIVTASVVVVVARRSSWARRAIRKIGPIGAVRSLPSASLWILAFWLGDMLAVLAVLRAVGVPASVWAAALVLLAINVAIAIPTPANGGTLELGAVVALQAFGVDRGHAFAFALLYHAAQVLPVLAVGLLDGSRPWRSSPGPGQRVLVRMDATSL